MKNGIDFSARNRKRGDIYGSRVLESIGFNINDIVFQSRKMNADCIIQQGEEKEEVWIIPKTKIKIEEKNVCGYTLMTMTDEDARKYCGTEWHGEWHDVEPPTDAELDMVKLGMGSFRVVDGKTVFVPKK